MRGVLTFWLLGLLLVTWVSPFGAQDAPAETCTWDDRESCGEHYRDPNLAPMHVDLGGQIDTVDVYVPPDIATYYNKSIGSVKKKETKFTGQFGKFINMSNKRVRVHWKNTNGNLHYIADITPFGAAGTATYPSHVFVVTDPRDNSNVLIEWKIEPANSLYTYDPYGSPEAAKQALWASQYESYMLQHRNLQFNKVYQSRTGRQWLALYGRKHKPTFPIWPADYFGQTHTVQTKETHFVQVPPDGLAMAAVAPGKPTERDEKLRSDLQAYRTPGQDTLTLNMTVLSVEPRAFEIQNFLSQEEVAHILELATGIKLQRSTTRAGSSADTKTNDSTRTSENSWIQRHRTAIIDSIYRRAADLLQIDEACFRLRDADEAHLVEGSRNAVTERLQLVHYDVGQQYTPHHDFSVPDLRDGQPSRFATLLLYLNEGMEGGETSFPRWLNAETTDILKVTPAVGKAILFYNVLPDGNYDERSQHAALPVQKGEKWLTNLWVWDPVM